ncbi:MAG: FAD-dependent monooxygenase [Pseudomonadota bacterium]
MITIVGAGIGGLSLAIRCRQLGLDVRILEARSAPTSEGAGIQIGPNASRLLDQMGVLPRLRPNAASPDAILARDGQSLRVLQRMPLGASIADRHGAPYLVAHRADLAHALLETATTDHNVPLTFGARVTDVGQTNGSDGTVQIAIEDAQPVAATCVIAADGLWSRLRDAMQDGIRPRFAYAGRCAARTVRATAELPTAMQSNDVAAWMSPDGHLVHYPVSGDRTAIILVTVQDNPGAEWGHPWDAEQATRAMQKIAPALAAGWARDGNWRRWPLFEVDAALRWHKGAIALLGDAAHPILPFLAQGGAMAIEDGWCLASHLATFNAPSEAFSSFEAERRSRVARLQEASRQNGRIFHLGGAMRAARNAALRTVPGKLIMRRYDWLYGWRPPDVLR